MRDTKTHLVGVFLGIGISVFIISIGIFVKDKKVRHIAGWVVFFSAILIVLGSLIDFEIIKV